MEEKIREEFEKDWSIDRGLENNEYYKTCIKLIINALNDTETENKEKIKEIKEIIGELEDEIGQI